jgi:diaminopimelate decarboxylase
MGLPFDKAFIEKLSQKYPTPFHIYDERALRARAKALTKTMHDAGVSGFKNFYAVKALPNPTILSVLKDEGMGVDCSSLAELELAERSGFKGQEIMFTSNNTTTEEFERAQQLGAIINFDDISFVDPFLSNIGLPKVACCRYNPGNISFDGVNEAIIGKPSEAKYGMTREQTIQAYRLLKEAGVKQFGLHTMLLSNELDWQSHQKIAETLFALAAEISKEVGITFSFINLGGGIGVPYKPSDKSFEIKKYAQSLNQLYQKYELNKLGAPKVYMENGRYISAEAGYLVTRVINQKQTYKNYIGVDASMANLMRPGMYGAYHHITVIGKEDALTTEVVDVVGALCENNDKFAIDRKLPKVTSGDYLVIHTTGAHGHSMSFQYNGKLRSVELLLHPDKTVTQIRRAETLDDYFATLTTGED